MYTDEFARQRDAAAFCFVVALMGLVVLLLATPWLLAVCASVLLVVGYFVVKATPRIQREERRRGAARSSLPTIAAELATVERELEGLQLSIVL